MKYLKTFEELTPEIYKSAADGIRKRAIKDKKIFGMSSPEREEEAEKKAKDLEDFAKEREEKYDPKKRQYNLEK